MRPKNRPLKTPFNYLKKRFSFLNRKIADFSFLINFK